MASSSIAAHLPDELVVQIAGDRCLDFIDRLKAARINRKWRAAIFSYPESWTQLHFRCNSDDDNEHRDSPHLCPRQAAAEYSRFVERWQFHACRLSYPYIAEPWLPASATDAEAGSTPIWALRSLSLENVVWSIHNACIDWPLKMVLPTYIPLHHIKSLSLHAVQSQALLAVLRLWDDVEHNVLENLSGTVLFEPTYAFEPYEILALFKLQTICLASLIYNCYDSEPQADCCLTCPQLSHETAFAKLGSPRQPNFTPIFNLHVGHLCHVHGYDLDDLAYIAMENCTFQYRAVALQELRHLDIGTQASVGPSSFNTELPLVNLCSLVLKNARLLVGQTDMLVEEVLADMNADVAKALSAAILELPCLESLEICQTQDCLDLGMDLSPASTLCRLKAPRLTNLTIEADRGLENSDLLASRPGLWLKFCRAHPDIDTLVISKAGLPVEPEVAVQYHHLPNLRRLVLSSIALTAPLFASLASLKLAYLGLPHSDIERRDDEHEVRQAIKAYFNSDAGKYLKFLDVRGWAFHKPINRPWVGLLDLQCVGSLSDTVERPLCMPQFYDL